MDIQEHYDVIMMVVGTLTLTLSGNYMTQS